MKYTGMDLEEGKEEKENEKREGKEKEKLFLTLIE